MLIRFKVSNYLSFDKAQTLSMISGKGRLKEEHIQEDKNLKLLKFSALFGANASGKSNLVKAMKFAKETIEHGVKFSSNQYCRIFTENKNKVTTFDFEIKIKDKYYSYGFDILLYKNSIRAEWLYEIKPNNDEKVIYKREISEGEGTNISDLDINDEYFDTTAKERIRIYESDIGMQDSILLLTVMNKNKDALYQDEKNSIIIFKDVYDWFTKSLTIISPNENVSSEPYYASEENLKKITEIISKFGTGIRECKIEKIEIDELGSKIPVPILKELMNIAEKNYIKNKSSTSTKQKRNIFLRVDKELYIFEKKDDEKIKAKAVKFEHKNSEGTYSFEEESDGTRRLLDLIEILLNKETKKVYVVDEFDRCFHPQITYKFVEEFLKNTEIKNSQLIITTHESRLLDFELLRRDEIWFVNREKNGPTELYSLEDYNERFDKKIDKAYLEGRYGGVPIFETVFPIGDDEE